MKTILIMGDESAISTEVENELADIGLNIDRIGGATRFETSALAFERVANRNPEAAKNVYIANGNNFPDALVVGGKAVENQTPVLLVERNNVPEAVREVLENNEFDNITIIGGQGVVNNSIQNEFEADRIFGATRNDTSVAMAKTDGRINRVFVTRDDFYTDALVSGPLAAAYKAPILLNDNDEATPVVKEFIKDNQLQDIYIIGGFRALSEDAVEDLLK